MLRRESFVIGAVIVFLFWCISLVSFAMGQRRSENIENNPPQLRIELQLFKTKYLLREPIWVRCTVTNVGKESGKFYFENLDALTIKDSKGVAYPCSMAIDRVPVTIKSGESLEKEGNLFDYYYGVPEDKFRVFRYLPPEQYKVYYELNQTVGSDKYKVYAKSQSDTFEVMLPKGSEVKVMNLLQEARDLFVEKKYAESISKLNTLVEDYPKSAYAPCALHEKVAIYRIGAIKDLDMTIESYNQMVNSYPNSREAVEVLSSLVHYYETKPDPQGLVSCLSDLIKKYPDTAVAKAAQNQLAKVKQ
jgi:hypothetical protein